MASPHHDCQPIGKGTATWWTARRVAETLTALGGTPVPWPGEEDCCGAPVLGIGFAGLLRAAIAGLHPRLEVDARGHEGVGDIRDDLEQETRQRVKMWRVAKPPMQRETAGRVRCQK